MPLQEAILSRFPAQAYALILVHDPDGLLADEELLAALGERGFRVVAEADPFRLRRRVEQLRPWHVERPLLVRSAEPLEALPYDLWQQGHRVVLALHDFFPRLAYPLLRALSPRQRWRLAQAAQPPGRLGQRGTAEYLLRTVFDVNPELLREPANLVAWLDRYHQAADPMPPPLVEHLLSLLCHPAHAGWPLEEMVVSRAAFQTFLQKQWSAYVGQQTGQPLGEAAARYLLRFDEDAALQDRLPGLVRSGALWPVEIERVERLPGWARPAVLAPDEDPRPRRAGELSAALQEHLATPLTEARWVAWQAVARAWAELTALRYDPDGPLGDEQIEAYAGLQHRLDAAFLAWLGQRYAPLAGKKLPQPHHLYHVPHYIAFQRRQGAAERVALLVLDGMALADWAVVGPTWRARHPAWQFEERLLLAQVPTITSVSRQALVSGLCPADFAATLDTNRHDPRRWAEFWAAEGLAAEACPTVQLALERSGVPAEVGSSRVRALCLIDHKIDDLAHDATLGSADFYASLQVWLKGYGTVVEELVGSLLERGFVVHLTSDHGHVEASGVGRPSEGLVVETRGRRARIYRDARAAVNVQMGFAQTVLWHGDGLLPDDAWVLMPEGRWAFDTAGETCVTHGGPTLDEVVVPLVTITRQE
ncbi:MAG TPA: BREX-3 system phosphatase PglZ [Chloroflexi bacterium]|nr:BREX-3 system phosphatase PglZ [Chloroflexota bacterium]